MALPRSMGMGRLYVPSWTTLAKLAYNTSKAIADLLKPLIGKTKYHVKNTVDFSKDLNNMRILEDEIMNSHDVLSLKYICVRLKLTLSLYITNFITISFIIINNASVC